MLPYYLFYFMQLVFILFQVLFMVTVLVEDNDPVLE